MPDGTTTGGLVLCNTSRSIAELGIELNHTRVIQVAQIFRAVNASAFDRGNQRNTLSLRVRRDKDFSDAAFADAEAAFIFSLNQPAQFPGTGVLKIRVAGTTTAATLYMLNTAITSLRNKFEDCGIAPVYEYVFNGGLITASAPF